MLYTLNLYTLKGYGGGGGYQQPGGGYPGGYPGQQQYGGGYAAPPEMGHPGGPPGGYGQPPQSVPGVSPETQRLFEMVDQDRSGKISFQELQAALINGRGEKFSDQACKLMIGKFCGFTHD